ncbi:transcription factor E2-alpha-like isoform X2 [Labeo rohita]|uniref:Transcription factor E2-alpha-like isoform X2 n=1 Tax=Labeo rohita TaxID=84645 RepID=A0A498NSA2_LABRO|nr:transcription factor E2-alpha-like isoform X2 [Labeo rohita]
MNLNENEVGFVSPNPDELNRESMSNPPSEFPSSAAGLVSHDASGCLELKSEEHEERFMCHVICVSSDDKNNTKFGISLDEEEELDLEQKAKLKHSMEEAFGQLSRMCQERLNNVKPQTDQVIILNDTMNIILALEQQIRDQANIDEE